MTNDEFDPTVDAEVDPADEHVRELLGRVAPAGPIPPEVSERIQAALRDLPMPGAEPPPSARPAPRVGRWLAAAAAVVVVGGGGTLLVQNMQRGSSAGTASADSAGAAQAPSASPERAARNGVSDLGLKRLDGLRVALPHVRSDHLAKDVQALVGTSSYSAELRRDAPQVPTGQTPLSADSSRTRDTTASTKGDPTFGCTPPEGVDRKDVIAVSYDSRLAQVVVTGSASDRTAQVYSCSGKKLLDSAPLPN